MRQTLRGIRLNFRYSAMIVLTLAVCLGTTTGIFAIVNSVLLQPLPGRNTDDILLLANRYPKAGTDEPGWSSGGDYYDRKAQVAGLRDQAMFQTTFRILEADNAAERVVGMTVTPSLFPLLQTSPQRGRLFEEAEGRGGRPPEGDFER